jgi:hypothetical protein
VKTWGLILCLCLGNLVMAADERIPTQEDFAWGLALQLKDAKPFYRLTLPLAVYTGVLRADLGDLRVINGQGDVVPQHLALPVARQAGKAQVLAAKLFPLYGTRDSSIEAIVQRTPRTWQEDHLSITTRERITRHDEVLRGYLLQLDPHADTAAKRLLLDWRTDAKGFVQRVQVESSNDLEHWQLHQTQAVIADLRFAGERLLQQDIPLDAVRASYLRLTPASGAARFELTGARVEYAGRQSLAPTSRLSIREIETGDKPGEYRFELPGPLPVRQLEVLPGEMNTFVRASLYSRADPQRPWRQRASGIIYKLAAEDEVLQQTSLEVGRVQARYWRLLVDDSSGGFGTAQPTLEVSWTAHELLFAARGAAPFTLVFGSARVAPVRHNALLLELDRDQLAELTSTAVQVGDRYEIGGRAVLEPPLEVDWKRGLLWAVLVLASLLLGWMAWSILRQMRE